MVNFSRNMQSHIDLINVIAVKIRFLFIEVYRLECIKTMWRQISELIQIQKKNWSLRCLTYYGFQEGPSKITKEKPQWRMFPRPSKQHKV